MSEQPKPLTPEEVERLLLQAAALTNRLMPVLGALEGYNAQPGRPDWWRQIQKNDGSSMRDACYFAGDLHRVLEHHLAEVRRWTVPGQPGFEALRDQEAFQAKLAAEGKGEK